MKKIHYLTAAAIVLIPAFFLPENSSADVVKKVVLTGNNTVSSAYVFQGSKNMKRRKSGRITSSAVVPHFSLDPVVAPSTVLPALVSPTIKPKPRFGYGSDYSQDESRSGKAPVYQSTKEPAAPSVSANTRSSSVETAVQQGQVIQFRSNYGTTEFYPVVPYSYGFGNYYHSSPFLRGYYPGYYGNSYGCGNSYRGFGSFYSRSRSSISVQGRNFSFQLIR